MVFDLFSKRARVERGDVPEVYTYDTLPSTLKVQITYLFDNAFRIGYLSNNRQETYYAIARVLREERGVFKLPHASSGGVYGDLDASEREVKNYFLMETNTEHALDVVELFFRGIHNLVNGQFSYAELQPELNRVIDKLNIRFREHGRGYALEGRNLIRIDSEIIHHTIVKPTLHLLHDKLFKNAEDEYLSAHEHYRNGDYEECLVDCLKAIETTIKIIGDKREWPISDKDTASKLIDHVLSNKLIPDYLQTHFNALRSCLESGVPTVRNKSGGHGKGVRTDAVPAYMAEYLLGSSATTIRFLVEADKAQPQITNDKSSNILESQ